MPVAPPANAPRARPRLTRAGREEGEERAGMGGGRGGRDRMGREEGEERARMGGGRGGEGGEGDGSEERRGRLLLRRLRPVVGERIENRDYILSAILVPVGNTNRE